MESPNSLYNNNLSNNNSSKDGYESTNESNIVIPSNFLISTKEIIARFPHNKRVGHYLLGRKLGEGSFAKVKEGLHTLTGQKVAIKVIDKKKAKEDAYVSKNMRREGKLLQMIIHPNIIQLYELMETENSYYLVTELCEGGDLMDYICARKYLSEVCTRKFIRQIISAVDYLHRIGILHRDLKIENLLLDKNLNIKLIDFGLSNYTKSELCITQCGSPAYAAPELLAHKKYGSKVDVWSIGVNMYAMLTGNLPFTVEPFNIKSLYNKMMKNEMNPIPEHLSKSGEDLLRKLLNPDPIKRISLKEAMEHPWINDGYASPLKPFPYPNKPTEDQVNPTILRYMNSNMEFNVSEVAENIKSNKPSSSLATYYLLLNKVKTMLMKIEPKKEKLLKPRSTESKIAVKEIKPIKTIPTITQPPQTQPATINTGSAPTTTTTTTTTTTAQTNAQSPLPRSVKAPVTTTITTTVNNNNSTNTNNQNAFTLIRNNNTNNKPDNNTTTTATTKYVTTKPILERTVSPVPVVVTNNSTTTTNTSTINGYSNPISAPNPATTFAGAIKNLTQKYKTMHLNSSIDTNGSINLSNSYNVTSLTNNNNNNNNNQSTMIPSSNGAYLYRATYLTNNLNNSVDHGLNSSTSGGEANNNSESTSSSSDDRHSVTKTTTTNLTNRNSSITPPSGMGKLGGGGNVEWTQMIRLNTGKLKSSETSNEMNSSNSSSGKDQFSEGSVIHLSQTNPTNTTHNCNTNGLVTSINCANTSPSTTTHMPVISSYTTNANLTNTSYITSRLNKSPLLQKLASPITLPSIVDSNAGRSSPQ